MRKRLLLVLVLMLALALCSGCKLIVRDMDVVNGRTVLQLGDQVYTRGQIDQMVEEELDLLEASYASYGSALDRTDPAVISDAQDAVLSSLTRDMVLADKANELNIALSEEDIAQLESAAEEEYAANLDFFRNYFMIDPEASEESVAALMGSYGYPASVQATFDALKADKQENLLMEAVTADITVSEEEVSAAYATNLEAQKADYETYPSLYESDLLSGETIYYTPAGFRYVKHIFLPFTEADAAAIADMNGQIAEAGEDADLDALADQLDTLKITALSSIQTTVDEVQAKIDAGEDFDALIETYSQDADSQQEPYKTNGYLVYAESYSIFSETFRDEAMALENVGDVSMPVVSDDGVHFIQFVSEVTEGETPFDSIRDTVEADTLLTKKQEAYSALVDSWIEEADVKINRNALK